MEVWTCTGKMGNAEAMDRNGVQMRYFTVWGDRRNRTEDEQTGYVVW
ncbi:MAG: hypothetical protein IPL98_16290 [Saprospiraceae bacterium]|nr:hypothetical protein [Saprospiraceae bacterium]